MFDFIHENKKKEPTHDIIKVYYLLWKHYKYIFEGYEAARKKARGRPRAKFKSVFRSITTILWTGGSWRSLPRGMGKRSTVHSYFLEWTQAGLFKKLWEAIVMDATKNGTIKSKIQIVDGTPILSVYMPVSISGFSYKHKSKRGMKLEILIDKAGVPLSLSLSSANVHDAKLLEDTLNQTVIKSNEPSKKDLLGDAGFIGEENEKTALKFGFTPHFRPKKSKINGNQKRKLNKNKKHRFKVEHVISWMKNMRRIRTCYEKSTESFLGFCQLCCAYLAFRKCYI